MARPIHVYCHMRRTSPLLLTVVTGTVFGVAGLIGCARAERSAYPASPQRLAANPSSAATEKSVSTRKVLTGTAAFGSWKDDKPGTRRRFTVQDLPPPFDTPSVDNGPRMIPRPDNAMPKVPPGFHVSAFATDLENPRVIITAPNGDIFVAESEPNRIRMLRDKNGDGKPDLNVMYINGLNKPFGLAFYPPGPNPHYLYVANTNDVVRIPYRNGDTEARGKPETIVPDLPGGARLRGGGHWTRDIVFSNDGKKMWVSVGSHSNNDEEPTNKRAAIHEYNPDGTGFRIYASGIRNPVGLAVQPQTGVLWTSVNERDGLGDNLPPEYVTHVNDGGFYGWPWFYIGAHRDPKYPSGHDDLMKNVTIPDTLIQAHSASLALSFYTGAMFPEVYSGDIFASEHGSWNRGRRTGYKVIRVRLKNGKATGEYDDFMTGFVTDDGDVWGRPVGVTVAKDGSLLVTDDGTGIVWRATYKR